VSRPSLLLVTDPAYPARGRRYGDEDVWLAGRLRQAFRVAACSPVDAEALMERFDVVLVRNSGPVMGYREAYESFRAAAASRGVRVVNPLHGRGDMAGKGHLVELSAAGESVIPTVAAREDLHRLPPSERYLVKARLGADSIGMEVVAAGELETAVAGDVVVQPRLEIEQEVSFVFVGDEFAYALRTVAPGERWRLEPFAPSEDDLAFARRFIAWNALGHGVQRVDGCRTADGRLLLVELEDLNPYLSLDVLGTGARDAFAEALVADLRAVLDEPPPIASGHA
jgi:hypothetical protein